MPTTELYVDVITRAVHRAPPPCVSGQDAEQACPGVCVRVLDHAPDGGATAGTCLLVHGFTQTAHSWDPLVEDPGGLVSSGYRAVCVDLRGHGKSSWATDGDYSRASMAGDVVAAADALGLGAFSLLGLSMGGALATFIAAEHPDRVRALVLVDWAPWPDGKPTKGVKRIGSLFNLRWDSFEEAVDMMHAANPRRPRENIALRMRQQLRKADDGWRWGTDPAISGDAGLRSSESPEVMWGFVRQVRSPALMIRGGQSDVVPQAQAELIRDRLATGRLAVVEGAGHSVIGDKPAESIRAILPFLDEHKAGQAGSARL